jgi:hypothetical protein
MFAITEEWRRPMSCAVRCFGVALLLASLLPAAEWRVGTLEDSIGGKYSSLRMDTFGNVHVCYCSLSQGLVGYGFWDKNLNRWFTTTVGRCSGFTSMVLDSKQHPHISYPDGTGNVNHSYWDGTSWQKQTVELHAVVINYYTSISVDLNDYPSISYYEERGAGENGLRLRVVTWNGKFWEARTVDSDQGSGKFNSMEADSKGNPQIAYGNVEYKNASLRYAQWNGHSWDVEILEGKGVPGTSMWSVALVLGKDGVPHIAYTDVKNRILKYGTRIDGKWELVGVDTLRGVAYPDRNGIALDERGNAYISYYDSGLGVLKVAHRLGRQWVVEVVDQNSAGFASSIQIGQGDIWVSYANETGEQLKVARRPLQDPETPAKPGEAR